MSIEEYESEHYSNYVLLARMIVWQACKRYISLKQWLIKDPNNSWIREQYNKIMEFFESPEFGIYTLGGDYEIYIKKLDEIAMQDGKIAPRAFLFDIPTGAE